MSGAGSQRSTCGKRTRSSYNFTATKKQQIQQKRGGFCSATNRNGESRGAMLQRMSDSRMAAIIIIIIHDMTHSHHHAMGKCREKVSCPERGSVLIRQRRSFTLWFTGFDGQTGEYRRFCTQWLCPRDTPYPFP